ncbi:MAG TPA: hypothetical protein VM658_20765 [bacterium]|nr:hypothetical protein [bacterium]
MAEIEVTAEMSEKYLNDDVTDRTRCPLCNSVRVEQILSEDRDDYGFYVPMMCKKCRSTWGERYYLSEIVELEMPER